MDITPSPASTRWHRSPSDDAIERVLFVGYCLIVGTFLAWAPWDRAWERLAWLVPVGRLRLYLLDPWVRSAVCGFGAMHLFWAIHDLDVLRTQRATDAGTNQPGASSR